VSKSSIFPRTELIERIIGSVVAAAAGTTSRIPLNRDSLIKEHLLLISVAQSFTGAPTSCDPGRFIKNISVETDKGTLFRASGAAMYHMSQFFEKDAAAENVLSTSSTSLFMIDLHYENSGAERDLAAAIEASQLNSFDLVIEWASDAENGFLGGTTPAAASYGVTVVSKDLPDLQHTGDHDGPMRGAAQYAHFVEEQVKDGSTAGAQAPVRLMVGNSTRAVMLVVEDTTGGSFVSARNDILTNISLVIAGKQRRKVNMDIVRFGNKADRGFSEAGVCVLDWEDDEIGFLNLENVAEAMLEYDAALPSGVTAFRVRILQDYTR
jgi:hypothetical protein